MLTSEQIQILKDVLLKEKETIEKYLLQNDSLNLEHGHAHESVGELSSYDNHPGDEGTELYEREKDLALKEHYETHLKNIEKALQAIEEGTYGKCEICGQDISFERLQAIPTTTYCVQHTPDQVVSHNRPIEEGVLMPPFGKFDFDDSLDENVAFDAEDSWQQVAEWGTSDSPSDLVDSSDHYNEVYNESNEPIGYVEDYENFIGTDMHGKNIMVFPNKQHEKYEEDLDAEDIMTVFGDLHPYEKEPYVNDDQ